MDKYIIKSLRSPLPERVCAAPGKYGSAPAVTRPQGPALASVNTVISRRGPSPGLARDSRGAASPALRLLRNAAVADVAAAAQQPREAGRSNSPATWLAEQGGLRAQRPPGQEREPGGGRSGGRTPQGPGRPNSLRAPCPSHSRFRIPRGPIQQLEPHPHLPHPTAGLIARSGPQTDPGA